MITIPVMATVAELQRRYRFLVSRIKKTGEPMVVVNNGKPDVVVVDADVYKAQAVRLRQLEEDYLLRVAKEGMDEHRRGKTLRLKQGQTLLQALDLANGN